MATFTDIVRKQRKRGAGIGSSLATAFSERAKERLDPRNYLFDRKGALTALFPGLKGYQSNTGKSDNIKSVSPESLVSNSGSESILNSIDNRMSVLQSQFKMVAKNSLVFPQMARDANITRQNIQKLVKLQGETPSNKADMFFRRASEREALYQSSVKETKPTKEKEKKDNKEKKGFFASLLDTIKDFIGPIISMITTAVRGFISGIADAAGSLRFLSVLLGPGAALAAGFAALAGTLVWVANLLPKPSPEKLKEISDQQKKYWKDIYERNGPSAVPETIRKELEKDTGSQITEEVKSSSSSGKAKAQESARFDMNQVAEFFGFQGPGKYYQGDSPAGSKMSGPVAKPGSSNSMDAGIALKSPEPFTKDFTSVVNSRSQTGDIAPFKHQVGTDLLAQVVVNKKVGAGVIDAVTGMNDLHHQKNRKSSLHTYGLAADFGFRPGATKSDKMGAAAQVRQELVDAKLVEGRDFTLEIEEHGKTKNATGDHLHIQFQTKSAADIYAKHAMEKYSDIQPTSAATNATRVPVAGTKVSAQVPVSDEELKAKAASAASPIRSDDKSYKAKPVINPLETTTSTGNFNVEETRKQMRLKELQKLNDLYKNNDKPEDKKQPIIINDNKVISGGNQQASIPMVAPSVYDTALEWYMSKLA